ncbi:hypothetical protein [Spartinivicinus ruber]|uniref:hypothetical protein n=1 Tax=Spartinivicinus ruber TaxID=2683272 RepID=UPI0013D7AF56|nr:hypothetical protein [Spartinivicinus ruber]
MKLISVDNIANIIVSGLDSLFTSDEERLAAKQKLQATLSQPEPLQVEEAKHPSLWVTGWRPGLGCWILLDLGVTQTNVWLNIKQIC